jgi:thiol:disulfide interchange protein
LWVLERTAGAQSQALVALLLAATAAGAFALGRIQRDHPGTTLRLYIAGFAAALAVAVAVVPLDPVEREAASQEGALNAWQPFANEAIAAELATNRPVFVYFTADWCITCKVNEGLVLEDGEVIDALARHNVATFKGDWTHRDEAIRLELARHGKAGVPVYLVYSPERPNAPHVLPELITVDVMLKALDRAAPRPAS